MVTALETAPIGAAAEAISALHRAAWLLGRPECGDDFRRLVGADPGQIENFVRCFADIYSALDNSGSNPDLDGLQARGDGPFGQVNWALKEFAGAADAQYVEGGSSAGNVRMGQALRLLLDRGRSKIAVDRQSHRSVFGALTIARLPIVPVVRRYDANLGVTLPLTIREIEEALRDPTVGAVWITAPTYDGFVGDLEAMAKLCKREGVRLIVDAAWGVLHGWAPHLGFPRSAIQGGAAASVTSLHKKGLGPSMASAAFFNDLELSAKFIEVSNLGLATTSPNAVAAAIVLQRLTDLHRASGLRAWEGAVETAREFSRLVSLIPGCKVIGTADFGPGFAKDPTHVVVNVSARGVNGYLLKAWFADQRIDLEQATHDTIMPIFGPGETVSATALADSLADALRDPALQGLGGRADVEITTPYSAIAPADAFYARRERVLLRQSEGRIAAQMVGAYPPGQAVICFGERITANAIASLVAVKAMGGRIDGIHDDLESALIETVAHDN